MFWRAALLRGPFPWAASAGGVLKVLGSFSNFEGIAQRQAQQAAVLLQSARRVDNLRQSPAVRLPLRKPLCAMLQQLEQRLSLIDFGHFRSWRKAIEGWRENGAGFSGAAG